MSPLSQNTDTQITMYVEQYAKNRNRFDSEYCWEINTENCSLTWGWISQLKVTNSPGKKMTFLKSHDKFISAFLSPVSYSIAGFSPGHLITMMGSFSSVVIPSDPLFLCDSEITVPRILIQRKIFTLFQGLSFISNGLFVASINFSRCYRHFFKSVQNSSEACWSTSAF